MPEIFGVVETFDMKEVSGWVLSAPEDGPSRVGLFVNDLQVAATWANDEMKRNAVPGVRGFRFNLKDLWAYVRKGDRISVRVGTTALPINGHGMFHRAGKTGSKADEQLAALLDEGYVFNQKGRIQLSKTVDTAWQKNVLALYRRCEAFLADSFGLDLFLCYGTMLGVVREGTFIGHDHDFDAAYISKHTTHQEAREELVRIGMAMINHGFKVQAEPPCLWVSDAKSGKIKIDIFHLYFTADDVLQFPFGIAGTKPFTRSDFKGLTKTKLAGVDVAVPSQSERFLATVYGDNWRTPNPGFSWRKDRVKRANEGRLSERERNQVYWSNFYAHTNFDSSSTFSRYVLSLESLPNLVMDIGCGDGRDAFAFATNGRRVMGIDRSDVGIAWAKKRAAKQFASQLTFEVCDLADAQRLSDLIESFRNSSGKPENILYYCRFILHAIDEATQDTLMQTLSKLSRPGDVFAAEFRTAADEFKNHVHGNHYRRYQDGAKFGREVSERWGFQLLVLQQGNGFSPYKGEDPELCRIIARK